MSVQGAMGEPSTAVSTTIGTDPPSTRVKVNRGFTGRMADHVPPSLVEWVIVMEPMGWMADERPTVKLPLLVGHATTVDGERREAREG